MDSTGSSFHGDESRPRFSVPPEVDHLPALHLSAFENLSKSQVHGKFNFFLRPYQRDGVKFLWDRLGRNGGGILCDDMGLGKTVQVIAFLSAVFDKKGNREDKRRIRDLKLGKTKVSPVLVVCPSSVLSNWEDELDTWGYFSNVRYHKGDRDKHLRLAMQGSVEVVITTFDTARQYCVDLNMVNWKAIVVDECHKIKENNSGVTQAMKSFTCNVKIGLTGTALQNKFDELWCLLDWANTGCLGSLKHFQAEFSSPMTKGFRQDASKAELANARIKQVKLNSLKQTWMIRRTKDGVIADQLPKKTDQVVFCGLSNFQLSVFTYLLSHPDTKRVLTAWDRCTCGKKRPRSQCCHRASGPQAQALLFQLMHIFLKVANHAALVLPKSTNSAFQAKLGNEICEAASAKFPELTDRNFLQLSDPKYSGKMEVLAGLLSVMEAEASKVLLFSYSTTLLDILEAYISSKGYRFCRLDGSTRTEIRQQLVNDFNNDIGIFIFLLSTKAGGLGLNITGANNVIIFDPNWNPSHDLQAQDRAYRLGQKQDVKVYRLVSAGCIEEIIYLRQLYKQQLSAASIDGCNAKRYFRAVQGDSRRKGELFGIKNLLRVTAPGARACLTEDIEKRNKDMEAKVRGKSRVDLSIHKFELTNNLSIEGDKEDPFGIGLGKELGVGGVVYSHVNQELVGGSKEEEHISHCAQKELEIGDGWKRAEDCELLVNTQAVCEPNIQDLGKYHPGNAGDRNRNLEIGLKKIVYGRTPLSKKKEIFSKLATYRGLDIKEFARSVLNMNWLEKYKLLYQHANESEKQLLEEAKVAYHHEEKELLIRNVSYNNVGRKSILPPSSSLTTGKLVRKRIFKEKSATSGKIAGLKRTVSTVVSDPFPSDDECLLTALDDNRQISSDEDDDKLLKVVSSVTSEVSRKIKPAPPGEVFKRKRKRVCRSIDSDEFKTDLSFKTAKTTNILTNRNEDTLSNIFKCGNEDAWVNINNVNRRGSRSVITESNPLNDSTIDDLFPDEFVNSKASIEKSLTDSVVVGNTNRNVETLDDIFL